MKKISIALSVLIIIIISSIAYNALWHNGTVTLRHHEEQHYHVVTVTTNDLPAPFFGAAFHLHYNPQELTFHHYTLGTYFSTKSPITLVNDKAATIIAGLSLKRGEIITKKEGELLHLYFEKGRHYRKNPLVNFSNTVFSTFTDKRKDLPVSFSPHTP